MELLVLFVAILFIIVATVRFKMHPVLSLTVAALFSGISLGLQADDVVNTITEGFGKTLSSIGLVIAFGAIIGVLLEKTGATQVLANTIIRAIGLQKSPMALNLAGFVISIPVYCDSGYVILSSLNKSLSLKTGIPKLVFAIALATGLYAAHVFVPPTPGPLAAAAMVEADLGLVMLLGLVVAIPVSLTGYLWANYIGEKLEVTEEGIPRSLTKDKIQEDIGKPSAIQAFMPLVVPIVLIAFKSIADYPTKPFGTDWVFEVFSFVGNPIIALFIGVCFAVLLAKGSNKVGIEPWFEEAMKQAGSIILITGAGGGFGAVLRTVDITTLFDLNATSQLSGLLICFAIAAILKTAQGSSTVAIITTAAIVAPLLGPFGLAGAFEKALVVLAIGAGAMTVSHINDSYFWVVSQFSGMDLKTALKGHSLATLFQGIVAIVMVLLLNFMF